jgi:S-adenosylmethionine synthetase
MPIKVITDGQIVHRLGGSASLGAGDRKVMLGYATVETAGAVLQDEEVSEEFLQLVKDGEVSGAEFYGDEKEAREADVPASPRLSSPRTTRT